MLSPFKVLNFSNFSPCTSKSDGEILITEVIPAEAVEKTNS
jgi:hypothetical protein